MRSTEDEHPERSVTVAKMLVAVETHCDVTPELVKEVTDIVFRVVQKALDPLMDKRKLSSVGITRVTDREYNQLRTQPIIKNNDFDCGFCRSENWEQIGVGEGGMEHLTIFRPCSTCLAPKAFTGL